MVKPYDELMHYGVKGMEWGNKKGTKEIQNHPAVSSHARNYLKKFGAYQRTRSLYVRGKAKKKDIESAKEEARNAAIEYKRQYRKVAASNAISNRTIGAGSMTKKKPLYDPNAPENGLNTGTVDAGTRKQNGLKTGTVDAGTRKQNGLKTGTVDAGTRKQNGLKTGTVDAGSRKPERVKNDRESLKKFFEKFEAQQRRYRKGMRSK